MQRGPRAENDDSELQHAMAEFVGAFEVIFHHDGDYAKTMIGDEAEGYTFLEPGLEDEVDDWGSRGALLEKYRKLRSLINAKGITPQYPFSLEQVRKFKGRNR